jgi:hypothetical protein
MKNKRDLILQKADQSGKDSCSNLKKADSSNVILLFNYWIFINKYMI